MGKENEGELKSGGIDYVWVRCYEPVPEDARDVVHTTFCSIIENIQTYDEQKGTMRSIGVLLLSSVLGVALLFGAGTRRNGTEAQEKTCLTTAVQTTWFAAAYSCHDWQNPQTDKSLLQVLAPTPFSSFP